MTKEHTGTLVIEDMEDRVKRNWHKNLPDTDSAGDYSTDESDDESHDTGLESGGEWLT